MTRVPIRLRSRLRLADTLPGRSITLPGDSDCLRDSRDSTPLKQYGYLGLVVTKHADGGKLREQSGKNPA